MDKRKTDSDDKKHFRTDRFSESNGQWYFVTRENTLEGPFATRFDAAQAEDRYKRVLTTTYFNDDEKDEISNLDLRDK
jgi:hypothetical protein